MQALVQQMRDAAALAEAWAQAEADPHQAERYRDQAKIWTWCADHVSGDRRPDRDQRY